MWQFAQMTAQASEHPFSVKMQSQRTCCLKCQKRRPRGDILVCSNWDCPIVVHRSCMLSAVHFDDRGSFYCPYCLYKKSLVKCRQAKEKALLANRALVSFLNTQTTSDNAEHWKDSKGFKRKKPDPATIIKKMDDANWINVECNGVHQPMLVERGHQDDSPLETQCGHRQQAGPMSGHCLGMGSAADCDGYSTKYCSATVNQVEYNWRLEEVDKQAYMTMKDRTKEIDGKLVNRSERMSPYSTRILMMKLGNAGRPPEFGDCRITDEEESHMKIPKGDVHFTREDTALVTQSSRYSINKHDKTEEIAEKSLYGEVEREQMQIYPRGTPWCLTKENTLQINDEVYKGNDCACQADCSGRTNMVENFTLSDKIREDFGGRKNEGERKEKTSIHFMRNAKASLPGRGLENLNMKHPEKEQTVEKHHDSVIEKVHSQGQKELLVNGISNGTYEHDNACQDTSVARKMVVKSGNANHSAEIENYLCRTDEKQKNSKTHSKAVYPTTVDNETVKFEKSEKSVKENEKFIKPGEQCYNIDDETVKFEESEKSVQENEKFIKPGEQCYNMETEQKQEDPREGYLCWSREKNTTAMTEELDEVKDNAVRDGCFPGNEMLHNIENADHSTEAGKDRFGKADGLSICLKAQDAMYPTREKKVEVTHKFKYLTRKHQETIKALKEYHDGLAEVEQSQAEFQSTKNEDRTEIAEESDAENYSAFKDECFLKKEIATGRKEAEQIAVNGEGLYGSKICLKLMQDAPQISRKGSSSVSHEEFGTADDSVSSNTDYLELGGHAGQKRQMQINLKNSRQHGKSSGYLDNDVEDYVVSTDGKSRQKVESIKEIRHSIILPGARRRKLPWTIQEEEMLKEGVQEYSMRANKNLPWMKILEFGRHVFDGTRTPVDLKDKWKNIKGKGKAKSDAK